MNDERRFLQPAQHLPAESRARAELARMGLSVERHPAGGVVIRGDGWQVHAKTARQALADMGDEA